MTQLAEEKDLYVSSYQRLEKENGRETPTWLDLGLKMVDLEAKEMALFHREAIAITYGVSLQMLGIQTPGKLGNEQEQVTFGEDNDWFPHISSDGQWMVFLTYDKSVTGHPENKNVSLRLMSLKDVNSTAPNFKNAKITVLAKLFGGQGTINVPSWSPDSKQLAFVSYQMVPKESM